MAIDYFADNIETTEDTYDAFVASSGMKGDDAIDATAHKHRVTPNSVFLDLMARDARKFQEIHKSRLTNGVADTQEACS